MSEPRNAESPVFTFHAEPVMKADTDPDPDDYYCNNYHCCIPDQSASYSCATPHSTKHDRIIGWYEDEDEHDRIILRWAPYYSVQIPGETEPLRFCEDHAPESWADYQEGQNE